MKKPNSMATKVVYLPTNLEAEARADENGPTILAILGALAFVGLCIYGVLKLNGF